MFWQLVLVGAAVMAAEAAPHALERRGGMKLCGRMLVEALATVCENDYYDPNKVQRKSQAVDKRRFILGESDGISSSNEDGFLDAQTALAFLTDAQLPRGVRGVADECCRKSCSFQQLVSYCGTAIKKRK